MAIRRDHREFKACKGNYPYRGRGGRRTRWEANNQNQNQAAPQQAAKAVQDWTTKNEMPGGANNPANRVGKSSGKPLECFKCGATTDLVAGCNQL